MVLSSAPFAAEPPEPLTAVAPLLLLKAHQQVLHSKAKRCRWSHYPKAEEVELVVAEPLLAAVAVVAPEPPEPLTAAVTLLLLEVR